MFRLAADLRDMLQALQLQVSVNPLLAFILVILVAPCTAPAAMCQCMQDHMPLLACIAAWPVSHTVRLSVQDVTIVGSSMGASIIWAYIELYGEDRLCSAVFVDQVRPNPASLSLDPLRDVSYIARCVERG